MQVFVGVVASDVEKIVLFRQVKKAEMICVVSKEDRRDFARADLEEVGDVSSSGSGVANDMFSLG